MLVNVFRFVLRIYNSLIFIQSVISGSSIADGNGDQIEGYAFKSKHLKCDQDRCDRTVGYTAENSRHSAGCTKRWGKSYKLSHHASKGSTYAEGRYDLTAAEACPHGKCGKDHFPEESQVICFSCLHSLLDQLGSGTHIVVGSEDQCDKND